MTPHDGLISVKRSTVLYETDCHTHPLMILSENCGWGTPRTRFAVRLAHRTTGEVEYWSIERNPILLRDLALDITGRLFDPDFAHQWIYMKVDEPVFVGGGVRIYPNPARASYTFVIPDHTDQGGNWVYEPIEYSRYHHVDGWLRVLCALLQEYQSRTERRSA